MNEPFSATHHIKIRIKETGKETGIRGRGATAEISILRCTSDVSEASNNTNQ
jgi:hypothetical protein